MIFRELDGSFVWDADSDEAVILALAEIHEELSFQGLSDEEINIEVRRMLEAKRLGMLN